MCCWLVSVENDVSKVHASQSFVVASTLPDNDDSSQLLSIIIKKPPPIRWLQLVDSPARPFLHHCFLRPRNPLTCPPVLATRLGLLSSPDLRVGEYPKELPSPLLRASQSLNPGLPPHRTCSSSSESLSSNALCGGPCGVALVAVTGRAAFVGVWPTLSGCAVRGLVFSR